MILNFTQRHDDTTNLKDFVNHCLFFEITNLSRLQYSIVFLDGTTTAFEDKSALITAVRAWKTENRDAEERPMLGFPLDIELEDGTTVTLADAEELMAQKESCAGN